jgi:hypothetical protein
MITVIAAIPNNEEQSQKIREINNLIAAIVNSLEYMAMLKKHNIIDDEICYDFLGFVVTEFYRWSFKYLSKIGDIHPRLYADFRTCGENWAKRREKEEKEFAEAMKQMRKKVFGPPPEGEIVK